MRKYYHLISIHIVILFVFNLSLFSKNRTEREIYEKEVLIEVIKDLEDSPLKLNYILKIADLSEDTTQSKNFIQDAYSLAKKLESTEGLISTHLVQATTLIRQKKFDVARRELYLVLNEYSEKSDPLLLAQINHQISVASLYLSDIDIANDYREKAISILLAQILKRNQYNNIARKYLFGVYLENANIHLELGLYNTAESFFDKAINIKFDKTQKDHSGIALAYIGKAKSREADPQRLSDAYTVYLQALSYFLEFKNHHKNEIINIYFHLSRNERKQNQPESALEHLKEALKASEVVKDQNLKGKILIEMGFIYFEKKETFSAYLCLSKGIPLVDSKRIRTQIKYPEAIKLKEKLAEVIESSEGNCEERNSKFMNILDENERLNNALKINSSKRSFKFNHWIWIPSIILGFWVGFLIKVKMDTLQRQIKNEKIDKSAKENKQAQILNELRESYFQIDGIGSLLESRLNSIEKDFNKGIVKYEDYQLELNKIKNSILYFRTKSKNEAVS